MIYIRIFIYFFNFISLIVLTNIDKVDDTMDEIREQMDIANEINDAISQPLGGETYDEVIFFF